MSGDLAPSWALDAILSEEAARIIDPAYIVNPACNWYFMIVSTFFIAAVGTWVTEADAATYVAMGVTGCVPKPASPDALRRACLEAAPVAHPEA